MVNIGSGPEGEAYVAQVSLSVAGKEAIAKYIGSGGVFVRHPEPVEVGSLVALDFVNAESGQVISRVAARVKPTPAAVAKAGPGVALQVVALDSVARGVLKQTTAHSDRGHMRGMTESLGASYFDTARTGPVVGIDLGTTNSCCAIVKDGEPQVITSAQGYETLPSVLYLTPENKAVVGRKAVEKMSMDPDRAIYGSKRFIGRPFSSDEVATYGHFFRYGLEPDKRGWTAAKIGQTVVSLEVVAAAILKHIRFMACERLNEDVTRAVITVPAYFGETQREAVRRAGTLAGFTVERILNEPTAGAVAYGFGKGLNSTILVYDLGGGTFDASVLRVNGDVMDVLATDGGPFLGGSDFDDRLTEHIASAIEREHGVNIRPDALALQRVRLAAEDCKRQLSEAESGTIDLPFLAQTSAGQVNVAMTVTRDVLEDLTRDLIDRTLAIVQSVLNVAQVKSTELDDVIMIGGQSRSPIIRRMLEERFTKQPTRRVHPDHAVAIGAALVAAAAFNKVEIELTDVLPASIRLGRNGATEVVLPRGKSLPATADVEVPPEADGTFRVELFRGEAEGTAQLEPIGSIELPKATSQSAASVMVIVNAEGLLSVTAEHPDTGEEQEFEVALVKNAGANTPSGGAEFLNF